MQKKNTFKLMFEIENETYKIKAMIVVARIIIIF
jgi:hypothetical protein